MNQVLICLVVLALNLSCHGRSDSLIAARLQKIEVRYVNPQITTSITVSCLNFETYFEENMIHSQVLSKSSERDLLIREINRIILKAEKFEESPDVRMKIQLYNDKKVETVCVGNTLISVKENSYLIDDAFKEFMEENFK